MSYFPYLVNMIREPNLHSGFHLPTKFNVFLNQGERSQGGYHSPLVAIQVKPKTPGHLVFIYVVSFNVLHICNVLKLIFNLYQFK